MRTFIIDGLKSLKTLEIGDDSFTFDKTGLFCCMTAAMREEVGDSSKSFRILNCESLESIQFGEYSFVDFAGDFELSNLPQLQSIQIGSIGNRSWNFFCCSFMIGSNDMILDSNR